MQHLIPPLPYSTEALAPTISAETINYHYGKHTAAYFDNLCRLTAGTEYADMPLEEIIKNSSGALYNNAAQAWNHAFYFASFSPSPKSSPDGALLSAIERDFVSLDGFKSAFVDAGINLFGSGWVWLASDDSGQLLIKQYHNADNPLIDNLKPLLTFDVWEHAYYIDYRNRRADALQALWSIVDWRIVESRYENTRQV